jgi:hypothetical protein
MVEAWLDGNDVLPTGKINSPAGLICALLNVAISRNTISKIDRITDTSFFKM